VIEHGEHGPAPDQSTRTPGDAPLRVPEVALEQLARALPDRINADPEHVENGLARLVLTVIELLREILEHQAIRRMDGGTLTEEQVERLGLALLKLNERMGELKTTFGLTDEDLNIDLGPLGRLR
jgi:gas vesicle protein GvpK